MNETSERLADAVKDVCWRAQPYGETEDGDTYAYLVTKGAMHRLIGAAQGAGVQAAFRVQGSAPLSDPPPAAAGWERAHTEFCPWEPGFGGCQIHLNPYRPTPTPRPVAAEQTTPGTGEVEHG